MNTNRPTYALIAAALVALAVAVVAARTAVGFDAVIGFGAVVAVLTIALADYRLSWRRLFGR